MNPTIISTIITAIASLVTCVLGIYAGKSDNRNPSIKKIREDQLFKVFSPLEQKLSLNSGYDPSLLISDIKEAIENNFPLIPPVFLDEFVKISKIENPTEADFEKIKSIISSFYNWLRKVLGYPYDEHEISPYIIPAIERKLKVMKGLSRIFSALSFILIVSSMLENGFSFSNKESFFWAFMALSDLSFIVFSFLI